MEIVVKIPDDTIKSLRQGNFGAKYNTYDLVGYLMNGTPLPKGHGDLIDRNDLLEYTDINRCAYTPTINRYDIITIPTIIEADKGE